jgi:FkbM family methyltransferase
MYAFILLWSYDVSPPLNWSGIDNRSLTGRFLRLPLRLLPGRLVVPILAGPNRGLRWRVGSLDHGGWLGSFEFAKQHRLRACVLKGMTAYDIGAHVGFYTLLFSRAVGDAGKVFAFEPWPRNIADCLQHVHMNHLHNVVVVPAAVGSRRGLASFAIGESSNTGMLAPSETDVRVACLTLDDLTASERFPLPDVIKVDVEGAESQVLEGASTLLRQHAATWFVALHSPAEKRACLRQLADAGYAVLGLNGDACDVTASDDAPDEIIAVRR